MRDLETCRGHLQWIEEGMNNPVVSSQSDSDCEFLRVALLPSRITFRPKLEELNTS